MSRLLLVLGLVGLGGCSSVNVACETSSPLVGSWRYAATRQTPEPGTAAGTLSITTAGCGVLTGQLDITETNEAGATQRLAGMVTGAVFDDGSIRFDAELPGGARQHLATVVGDSLEGNWASVGGTFAASGSFGGHRK
jgi:hypothetical protein